MKFSSIAYRSWLLSFGLLLLGGLAQPQPACADLTYDDGGTHSLTTPPADANKKMIISNGTTVDFANGVGSYPLKGFTATLSGGSTLSSSIGQEILGNMAITADASTISLKYMTANDLGITLKNGAVLKIGNAGNNTNYGGFLGNGTGGLNVTAGTASIYFLNDVADASKGYSTGTLRDSKYKINVSTGATLELYGGLRSHYANSKIVVNGPGTLNLNAGEIGSRRVSDLEAGELSLEAGTTNWIGATLYAGTKVTLTNSGTTLNLKKASALSGSGTVTLNAGTVLNASAKESLKGIGTITGSGTVNASTMNAVALLNDAAATTLNLNGVTLNVTAQDALQGAKKITVTNGKITGTAYTTINGGLELNGTAVTSSGNYSGSGSPYGSFLFNSLLTVTGGTASAPATSSLTTQGMRFRTAANSILNVSDYAVLKTSGNVTFDGSSSFSKTGKGTWDAVSGTIGIRYPDGWKSDTAAGTILVQEGTLKMSGAKFFTAETVTVAPAAAGNSAVLEGAILSMGSKVTYNITGTAGAATPNAIFSLTAADALYQNFGTINLTNALMTNSAFGTIDSEVSMTNSAIEATQVGSKPHYGAMLLNGTNLAAGKHVLNVLSGTNSLTTPTDSTGVRLRGANSEINVADGATLNVASGITYDVVSKGTGIIKMGGGLMNVTRGTIGGYDPNYSAAASTAGVVRVNGGTLKMSGNSTFYANTELYVANGATLDLGTSATFSAAYHLIGSGANGAGALLLSNNRTITNTINLDADAAIGVASGVTGTISSAITSNKKLTKVGPGILTLDAANNTISALDVQNGTVKLGKSGTLKFETKTIRVSGASSVLELAANDAIFFNPGAAAGVNGITIENGGTMTNTSNTHVTLTYGFTLQNGTLSATGEGNKIKGTAANGLGIGYGNYLLIGPVSITGTGVSTIDAYRIRLRANSGSTIPSGGNFTIAPTAVLETNARFDTDQNKTMTVTGGGTLRPTATTFTTPGLTITNSRLDLTALNAATTGTDWQLLATAGGGESLATIDIAQKMSSDGTLSSGALSMNSGSALSIDLTQTTSGLVGQTILADGFSIDDATLVLNLDDSFTTDAVGSYKLFDDALLGSVNFSNLIINGDAGELVFSLNGNQLSVGLPEPAAWLLLVFGSALLFRLRRKSTQAA